MNNWPTRAVDWFAAHPRTTLLLTIASYLVVAAMDGPTGVFK